MVAKLCFAAGHGKDGGAVDREATVWENGGMEIRFYLDPETGQPHIYNHGITEDEVRQVFAAPCEDLPGDRSSRMRLGQTEAGRYLQVIYAPGKIPGTMFVITAYELKGKAKKAHRRRQRRKGR